MGKVFALLLYGAHVGGELHGQEAGGLGGTADDVEHRLVLHLEGQEHGVCVRLNLGKHNGARDVHHYNHRLLAHLRTGLKHKVEVRLVIDRYGLALVRTVDERLLGVSASDGLGTGVLSGIRPVLQADGDVAVASADAVLDVVAAAGERLLDDYEGEICLNRAVRPIVILLHKGTVDRILPVSRSPHGQAEHAGRLRHPALRHVHLGALCRQHAAVVLEHHHGLDLGLIAQGHEIGVADQLRRIGRAGVRVLEEAGAEGVHQQADGGLAPAGVGGIGTEVAHPHLIGFEHGALVVVAAKLVYAGFEHLVMPLGHGQRLAAPALAVEGLDGGVVVGDVPVCADYSVVAIFAAEQVSDNVFAVAVADVVAAWINTVRNCIIRHYRSGAAGSPAELERALGECAKVLLKAASGVDRILAVVEVGVASALLGAA